MKRRPAAIKTNDHIVADAIDRMVHWTVLFMLIGLGLGIISQCR